MAACAAIDDVTKETRYHFGDGGATEVEDVAVQYV